MAPHIDQIAIFPLSTFLFPGEAEHLYIFEDRYKQLVNDCEEGLLDGFGILYRGDKNHKSYGCFVKLAEVMDRHPNGELDIVVECVSVFTLSEYFDQVEGKLYPAGKVSKKPIFNSAASNELVESWKHLLVSRGVVKEKQLDHQEKSLFNIASTLELEPHEKIAFLDLGAPSKRESYLMNYLDYLDFLYEQEEKTFEGFFLN